MAETIATSYGHRDKPQILRQNGSQRPLETFDSNSFKLFEQRAFLTEEYQNLEYRGYVDLLAVLPKKADGKVNKKLAYETVFKVWKTEPRRVYSAFIDWLEMNFN